MDGDTIPDFNDPDGDGCPDIDIVLTDKDGKTYKLNVDSDEDGIPDMNIDSDGDGLADINVDTDKDGKPDLNLVIITKEMWKPTFCVTIESDDIAETPTEYCTTKGIKAVINIDTGKDGIPDINIDTTGDMKPDLNIPKDGSDKPFINITTITTWKPDKDFSFNDFQYDSATTHKPHLNIDSDGNGRPDINIDVDGDGVADMNVDVNGDGIPDTDIDGDGDGQRDFNIDKDNDGKADENIIEIPQWKPDTAIKDSDFDTMGGLKLNDTLIDEESGAQIQKPGENFLPNYSIKVDNIKDTIDETEKDKIEEFVKGDAEIKEVYDIKLSDGTTIIQPDGTVKVRIPVSEELENSGNVKVVVEQKDGTYKEVNATIKDGYIEYETDFLGKVGLLADKVTEKPTPDEETPEPKPDVPIPDFKPNGNGGSTPVTSVKGNYTSGIGGAGTGDVTSNAAFMIGAILSITVLFFLTYKRRKEE